VYGRRRFLPYINDADKSKKHASEREGVNMPIQSAASDTLLIALCIIDRMMIDEHHKSLMVNTVHDSSFYDVYPGELPVLATLIKEVKINVKYYTSMLFNSINMDWLTVPLDVDLEVGHHYGSIRGYKE
jgi:DNA polymerase I-like protein with 3'-5' exonuclease and polymerase domains